VTEWRSSRVKKECGLKKTEKPPTGKPLRGGGKGKVRNKPKSCKDFAQVAIRGKTSGGDWRRRGILSKREVAAWDAQEGGKKKRGTKAAGGR